MDKAGCLTQQNGMRPGPDTEAAGYGLGTIITVAAHLAPLLAARVLRRARQEGGSSVIKVSLRGESSACLDRLQRGRAPVVAAVSRQERTEEQVDRGLCAATAVAGPSWLGPWPWRRFLWATNGPLRAR